MYTVAPSCAADSATAEPRRGAALAALGAVFAQLSHILIALSLAAIVISIGMSSTRDDLLFVLRRPAVLFRAVLAVDLIPPIVAAILIWFLPLDPAVKAGILLMAIAPVPPLVPGKALKAGGNKAYTVGVYVALSLLTIVTVPLVFYVTVKLFGRHERISASSVAATVLTSVLIPLGVGTVVRMFWPAFADRAAPWIAKLSPLLLVVAFVPVLAVAWPQLAQLVGNGTLAAMTIVIALAAVAGHVLGGPEPANRHTLAIAAATRHPGLAIMIASSTVGDKHVVAAILLFLLAGVVVVAIYKQLTGQPRRAPAPVS
jgi:bile acid:Na+ symporter, BASS family